MVSSRWQAEFTGDASPRVKLSKARQAPRRPKAYSSRPRSVDSWPGREVTASTVRARGSGPTGRASGADPVARSVAGPVRDTRWSLPARRPTATVADGHRVDAVPAAPGWR